MGSSLWHKDDLHPLSVMKPIALVDRKAVVVISGANRALIDYGEAVIAKHAVHLFTVGVVLCSGR